MSVQNYFENIAQDFDSYYEKPKNWFQDLTNRMLRKPALKKRLDLSLNAIDHREPRKILDIGCGSGVASIPLAQAGHNVTAIDFSEEMLKLARARAQEANVDVDFQVADFMEKEFKDLDACLALGVLEYFENSEAFIEKMLSHVKPGGRVIFDIPALYNVHTPFRLPYLLWRKRRVYFYSPRKARKLIEPFQDQLESHEFNKYGAGYLVVIEKK